MQTKRIGQYQYLRSELRTKEQYGAVRLVDEHGTIRMAWNVLYKMSECGRYVMGRVSGTKRKWIICNVDAVICVYVRTYMEV